MASVGGARGYADWTNPDHRLRRLLAEFLGMAGLTFVLSGGAAILARYGGRALSGYPECPCQDLDGTSAVPGRVRLMGMTILSYSSSLTPLASAASLNVRSWSMA